MGEFLKENNSIFHIIALIVAWAIARSLNNMGHGLVSCVFYFFTSYVFLYLTRAFFVAAAIIVFSIWLFVLTLAGVNIFDLL
jgi:hypothetical protein